MYNNKISVIGTGYVGLVGGVCMADFGNNVINVDIDEEKIRMLKNGEIPIYEPGLEVQFERNVDEGRIEFTTDLKSAIEESEVIFISVGTPSDENGKANLCYVKDVAHSIGKYMNDYKVVVDKSTVPVGTGRKVESIIQDELDKRGKNYNFDVVSNPEFLREGKAVYDFTHPDRVVIGTESEKAQKILKEVYRPLYLNNTPFVFTNLETAEMIKYASNAFLATKISFINEMANLCEEVNANVQAVARAMGMDGRIGDKFLHAGPGYGGSCFPKDTRAITNIAEETGVELKVIKAGIEANEKQKQRMVDKIVSRLNSLKDKTIGVLGLTFKPETDDMKETPSLTIMPQLIEMGTEYISIILIGSIALFFPMISNNILRGEGNTITPMVAMLIGSILNIILDPFFIYGFSFFPAWGIRGAAIATVLARIISAIFLVFILFSDRNELKLNFSNFNFDFSIVKSIYIVGFPAMVMQFMASFMLGGMNRILASFSSTAIAAAGIYFRLQSFVFMPVFGLNQGYMPLVGYNYGHQKPERMKKAIKSAFVIAFAFTTAGFILFQVMPTQLIKLFNKDPELIKIGTTTLKTISLAFPIIGPAIIISTTFQAIGKGIPSLLQSFFRQIVVLLPLMYWLGNNFGLSTLWYAFPISELANIVVASIWLIFTLKKVFQKMNKMNEEKFAVE